MPEPAEIVLPPAAVVALCDDGQEAWLWRRVAELEAEVRALRALLSREAGRCEP